MSEMMRVVLIGAGNLATNLGKALHRKGDVEVVQVFSRTLESAAQLAGVLHCGAVNSLDEVVSDADVYVVSVKDSVLADVIGQLCPGRETGAFLHTAGSMPMTMFEGKARHYGVFYPMQTFSKSRELDFSEIPCFVEASDELTQRAIRHLGTVSTRLIPLSSADRKYVHLAAVFACNFSNHCYSLAAQVLEPHGIPFDVMLPLIDETARKVHQLSPREAQTGPAVRYDENVIAAQMALIEQPKAREIYELMTHSIHDQL